MNVITRSFPLALCMAGASLVSAQAWAQDTPAACHSVSSVQRRIVERADLGMAPLRGFVRMMDIVHGVNMRDVQAGLDTWRAAVDCQKQVAAAEAAKAEANDKVAVAVR